MRHDSPELRSAMGFLATKPVGAGFVVLDTARRILYADEELCRISRQPRSDLVGFDFDLVLAGRRWLEVLESPIYGKGGEVLGSFAFIRMVH